MSEFLMPSLGADMEAGTLVEWLKQPGDEVHRGDVIAVVETQKGAIEVEIFEDGVLDRLLVELGTEVPVGAPMAYVRSAGEAAPAKKETARAKVAETSPLTSPTLRVGSPPLPRGERKTETAALVDTPLPRGRVRGRHRPLRLLRASAPSPPPQPDDWRPRKASTSRH